MSDAPVDTRDEAEITFEFELDAAPEKVWRAISIPAFRERWLPQADLAESEPIVSIPGVEAQYRMRENGVPPLESTVTFRIEPSEQGGTVFRIIHRIEDAASAGANDNRPVLTLAA